MGTYIEVLTVDGDRHYSYNPDEEMIESLIVADAIEDLGLQENEIVAVAITDNPEVL